MLKLSSKITIIFLAAILIAAPSLLQPKPVLANANLSFAPTGQSITVGQKTTLQIRLSTSVEVTGVTYSVAYPSNLVKAVTIQCGSDFGTPIAPSIANGTASISCARIGVGPYKGSSGKVGSITLQGTAVGSAKLTFGVSKVVANDGQGSNVYRSGGTATISIAKASSSTKPSSPSKPKSSSSSPSSPANNPTQNSTTAPKITSKSHPDSSKWYTQDQVQLAWTDTSGQASGYSLVVDQHASTQAPTTISHTATTASHTLSKDGVWYAHLRSQSSRGWSATTHFKIQYDHTPPTKPTITIQPDKNITVIPTFTFASQDKTSSIASYQVKFDQDDWQKVSNPFKPKTMTTGQHTITVKVADQAGNSTQASQSFSIEPIQPPTITSPDSAHFAPGQFFKVAGTTIPQANVTIFINGKKSETVTADKQGNFQGQVIHFQLDTYEITAQATNADGLSSAKSEPLVVQIGGVYVLGLTLPDWLTYAGILAVIAILIAIIGYLSYRLHRLTKARSNPSPANPPSDSTPDQSSTGTSTPAAPQPSPSATSAQPAPQLSPAADTAPPVPSGTNESVTTPQPQLTSAEPQPSPDSALQGSSTLTEQPAQTASEPISDQQPQPTPQPQSATAQFASSTSPSSTPVQSNTPPAPTPTSTTETPPPLSPLAAPVPTTTPQPEATSTPQPQNPTAFANIIQAQKDQSK